MTDKILYFITFVIIAGIVALTGYFGFHSYSEAKAIAVKPLKYANQTISRVDNNNAKIDFVIKEGILEHGILVTKQAGAEELIAWTPIASFLRSSNLIIKDKEQKKWIEVFSAGVVAYTLERTWMFCVSILGTTAILVVVIGFPIAKWEEMKQRRKKVAA
jgi:hypothetical protein